MKSEGQSIQERMRREQQLSLKCIVVGRCYNSAQNGNVYDTSGLSPTLCVGCHSGVEPHILVYE